MNLSTTRALRDAIFSSLNNPHSVCIFPNETIRRFWIQDYALKGEKGALLLNRVLAWDTFSTHFVETQGKEASDYTTRWIFAQQLIEQKSDELLFFIQPYFPRLNNNLTSSVVSLISKLTHLKKIEEEDRQQYETLPHQYRQDVDFIEMEYKQFLEERGLYDSSLLEKTDCLDNTILASSVDIFFPELCTSFSEFEPYVHRLPSVHIYRVKSEKKVPLLIFDNERIEIDTTFVHIKKLLQQGVHTDDIIVSVGSLDRIRPYVKTLAERNNLNLHIVSGASIFDYSVGSMFLLFKEVYQYHFDIDRVKKLLLNPTIPWKEEALHRALIERALDLHIHQRVPYFKDNDWQRKLDTSYKDDKKLYDYAHRLFQIITNMVTSRSGKKIAQFLLMIQKNYFKEGAFTFDATLSVQKEETQAYTFCLEQLKALSNQLESCKLEISSSLYSFFITLLQSKKFNPIGKKEGIKVYDWTHGIGLAPEYHFFIDCSSSVVDTTTSSLPLVPFFTISEESDYQLDYYMVAGENIIYSYSLSGFVNTSNLPPSFFVRNSLLQKAENIPITLLALEEKAWQDGCIPPQVLFSNQQREGFRYASSTFFTEKRIDVAHSGVSLPLFDYVKNGDNLIPLSSSSIETFESCPFTYIASKVFKLRVKEYDELILDHGEIGSLQHNILATFFERVKQKFSTFHKENRQQMFDMLLAVVDEMVSQMLLRWGNSNYYIVQYIKNHYFIPLFLIIDNEISFYNGNQTKSSELALSFDDVDKEFHLEGRIDRVVTVENDVVIIDYKKSSTPTKKAFDITSDSIPSYQLPLYSLLIEKSLLSEYEKVDIASYYNIKDGKYVEIWNHDNELVEHLKLLSEATINKMVERIKLGDLGATPSSSSCKYCDYRQLCRRRYSLP